MRDDVFEPFPVIRTENLLLRRIIYDDLENLFKLRSDELVMRYIERPRAGSMEDVVKLWNIINEGLDKREAITWGITKEGMGLIGTIGFWKMEKENARAEIGYLLNPVFQGKGLMKEAIRVILNFGFEKLDLHSVEANVNPQNQASIRLLERNGFKKEGYFRENFYFNGKFLDTVTYGLLNPDPHHRFTPA